MTYDFLERSGIRGYCFSPTSTRHSSCRLALKEVRVCSWYSGILLQTSVQFHMEPILILLLYGSALSILSPFLCTFTQRIRNTLFTPFLNKPLLPCLIQMFSCIYQQWGAHLLQRKLHTSLEEDELAAGRAE